MSSGTVEQIKARLGIAEVVGLYVKLEKAGANYKAKCPFHNEKTPSLFVSPARGTYYCFGCGAKGDIFSFIQEFEGVDFVGALKTLAERAGVPLEYERREMKSERDRLYSVMEHAALFFQKTLSGATDALLYLKKRGLKIETVRAWRLGFAAIGWTNLKDYLITKGFSESEIEKAGLAKRADEDKTRLYDRFRGRVMFPIFDSSGRDIAFSGRILVDDGVAAKYLNSPETPLFSKSEVLYGFDKAKLEIKKRDAAVIVEGQMDLLMSHQAGITNTVAVSGTALTPQHLSMLKRLAPAVILAFDSDKAGFAAAMKSAEAALGMGIEVKVAEIISGKDPADLILADPKLWEAAIAGAKHIVEYVLGRVVRAGGDKLAMLREIRAKVLPYVARIESPIEQAHFIQKIAHEAGVSEQALRDELKKITKSAAVAPERNTLAAKPYEHKGSGAADHIFGILFKEENTGAAEAIKKRLKEAIGEYYPEARARAEVRREELIFEVEMLYGDKEKIKTALDDLLKNLEEESAKKKVIVLMEELQDAERTGDKMRKSDLIGKISEAQKKLKK